MAGGSRIVSTKPRLSCANGGVNVFLGRAKQLGRTKRKCVPALLWKGNQSIASQQIGLADPKVSYLRVVSSMLIKILGSTS